MRVLNSFIVLASMLTVLGACAEDGVSVSSCTVTNDYAVTVGGWTTNNWVFAPTVLYGGNRHRAIREDYPPVIKNAPAGMPITMTDVYRLSNDGSPSKVEFLAGDTAAPMFGWWDPRGRRGTLILAEPFTSAGETGFCIEECPSKGLCVFRVSAPGCRSRRYRMTGFVSPSGDVRPAAERSVELKIRRLDFAASSIGEFLDVAFTHRKDITGMTTPPRIEPFGTLLDALYSAADKRAWYEKGGYFLGYPPNTNGPCSHLQFGWCGAPVYAMPFLLNPTEERIRRVSRTFDTLASMSAKSGFFYAICRDGVMYGDGWHKDLTRSRALVRRQTAGLFSGLDALAWYRVHGHEVKGEWERAFRRAADALVRLWRSAGELGQFVDVETGELMVPNSTNGALAPAALLAAAQYFGDDSYVKVAVEIAERYRDRDLSRGYSGGGPAEALQCPDSESAGELVVSFERLWEQTGERRWLDAACEAVSLLSTWVNAWNYPFPKDSRLGAAGTRSCGAVWANVQNRHGAPGHFHYGSGDVLFRLWRATGDERIWELMTDTACGVGQYVHTDLHPIIPEGHSGGVSERVNTGDWEGRENVGNRLLRDDFNMCWVTTAMFHMISVPGVYVINRKGGAEVHAIDRIRAELRGEELVLTNETDYKTTVTLMVESSDERLRPLGPFPSEKWLRVALGPGEVFRRRL